jgi:hypothetical protein
MGRVRNVLLCTAVWVLSACSQTSSQQPFEREPPSGPPPPSAACTPPAAPSFAEQALPLVTRFCMNCHSGSSPQGNFSLDSYTSESAALANPAMWLRVSLRMQAGEMPPAGLPRPDACTVQGFEAWLTAKVTGDCRVAADPGTVTLHRLNRTEYANSVRALLGLPESYDVASALPDDATGYGFDDVADVLAMAPLLMEKYGDIAEAAVQQVVPVLTPSLTHTEALAATADGTANDVGDGFRMLFSGGDGLFITTKFPADADYVVRTRAYQEPAGPDDAKLGFFEDGDMLGQVTVPALKAAPGTYETRIHVKAGNHTFEVAFINDFYHPDPPVQDRNVAVNWFEFDGPYDPVMPDSYRQLVPCDPIVTGEKACVTQVFERLAALAYRRPVSDDDVGRLVNLVESVIAQGDPFAAAIQIGIEAILQSPNFLFRVESEAPTSDAQNLEDHELATRLSYFLWSAPPDAELRALADAHQLSSSDTALAAQVDRMLADPRSHALVVNFADQWLGTRDLADLSPDPKQFPTFTPQLRAAIQQEMELTFDRVLRQNLPVQALVDPDFLMVDQLLAGHYGLAVEPSNMTDFVSVPTQPHRGGLLRMAGFLALTSNPTRTSPTKRGRYVLDRLLCTPPPAPPPNVPALSDSGAATGSVRTRMEQHRANPVCAACHTRLDPIGFALENYDAIGQWRTDDNGFPLDTTGSMPDGRAFSGPDDMIGLVRDDPHLPRCVAEKLLTYGLGRGVTPPDGCSLDSITQSALASGGSLRDFIKNTVLSRPFRMRRGEDKPQ